MKENILRKFTLMPILSAMILLTAGWAMAYTIRNDLTGGDCTAIGSWNDISATCTLSNDINEGIQIESDNITFDGNGHIITGADSGIGVYLLRRAGITVKNTIIRNFEYGILLDGSNGNTITGNNSSYNTRAGIFFKDYSPSSYMSNNNIITGNTASQNWYYGIQIYGNNNIVSGNSLMGNNTGIHLYASSYNTFFDNDLIGGAYGIHLNYGCYNNEIYNNCFTNIATPANKLTWSGSGNLFSLNPPDGGNYWSNFDTQEEGCTDSNNDGFCDSPYYFEGGVDYSPWTVKNGWNDADSDGYAKSVDCDDNNPSVNPAASEIKHDGIDQDCNGYDLTIDITKAVYDAISDSLRVEATSSLNGSAVLVLSGYAPMLYKENRLEWYVNVEPAGGNPGIVTVCGIEGCEFSQVSVE